MAHGSLAEAAHSKRLSAALCRHGFQHVQQTVSQLIHILRSKGPDEVVDMDHAALRVTLDVIGQVGFGKDFGATKSLDATDTANAAFATMEAGLAFWNSLAALSRPGWLSFAWQECHISNLHPNVPAWIGALVTQNSRCSCTLRVSTWQHACCCCIPRRHASLHSV